MDDRNTDPRVGSILGGRYRVEERIGAGAMGVVYRAEQIRLGRKVAIKFLSEVLLNNDTSRARFEREAQAMSRLTHPNCVSVIDYGVEEAPYIVMEHVDGPSMKELAEVGAMEPVRAVRLITQLLAGLAHAHEGGIVHRDIKPGNIIVQDVAGTGDHVRILDFSLAKMLGQQGPDLTATLLVMGTPYYMSPEQTVGGDVDERSDLYSAGIVLFELLFGRKPFEADDVHAILRMHREETPPELEEKGDDGTISDELSQVLCRAMAKRPEARFASAGEFLEALGATPEAEASGTITVPLSTPRVEPEVKDTRRVRLVIAGGVVVALAAALALLFAARGPTSAGETAQDTALDGDKGMGDIAKMIAAGRDDEAIEAIQQLRISDPENPELPCLLGTLFARKGWWGDAFDRFAQAIDLDPTYRRDERLNRDLIRSLGSDKAFLRGQKLIIDKVGSAAIPHLERASAGSGDLRIKRRATSVLKTLRAD